VALNIGVGIQTGGANGSQNFEAMIVSDLEFLGLRKHQGYEHRQAVREVEAEVSPVPEEVSGVLVRSDHPNASIISATQAESNQTRVSKADKRIDELLKSKRTSRTPHNINSTPKPAMMKPSTIVWPHDKEPTAAWWDQFTHGDNTRLIERETATQVCRVILRETLGATRAQSMPIKFADGLLTLRDLHAAIEELVGPKGWQTILKKAGDV
jgi:hypothetical protein